MIAQGLYKRQGVSAPEFIGQQPECVHYVLSGLKDRGVVYKETVEVIEDEKLKKEYGKKLSVIGAIK
jgi:hypothetical protein